MAKEDSKLAVEGLEDREVVAGEHRRAGVRPVRGGTAGTGGGHAPNQRSVDASGAGDTTPQDMRSTGGESHANSGGRAPRCGATKTVMGREMGSAPRGGGSASEADAVSPLLVRGRQRFKTHAFLPGGNGVSSRLPTIPAATITAHDFAWHGIAGMAGHGRAAYQADGHEREHEKSFPHSIRSFRVVVGAGQPGRLHDFFAVADQY